MPKVIVKADRMFTYSGKASLLDLLDRQQALFLDLFEEAARNGWISGDRFQNLDQEISHVTVKYDVPQR